MIAATVVGLVAGVAIGVVAAPEDDDPADRTAIAASDPDGEAASSTTTNRRTTTTRRITTTTRPTTTTEAPEVGTRADPLPLGETAAVDIDGEESWRVKVLSFTPNANDVVANENQFNAPPEIGLQFAIVQVEVTYVGDEEPTRIATELTFKALDSSNVTYDFQDTCGVIPSPLDTFVDVYRNGVVTGNLCFAVAADKVDSLLLILEAGFGGEPFFMALR